ncbi:MAG: hypothetical protein IIB13_07480 [Chloroflexi bacterium]|nr:hypothetical protein [Chloroflexota bacterium]
MSKSLGNYIGVAEPPEEIYGKAMSIRDDLIGHYFELVTDVPDEELKTFEQGLADGTIHPMELKKRLARELVTQLYDRKAANEAETHFARVVQNKEVPEEIRQVKMTPELIEKIKARLSKEKKPVVSIKEVGKPETTREWDISVPLLLYEIGLAKSRSDAKRLIAQEAVHIDNRTIYKDYEEHGAIKIGSIIKVGKRRFVKLVSPD